MRIFLIRLVTIAVLGMALSAGWGALNLVQADEAATTIAVKSEPAGAALIVNGRRMGMTPIELTLSATSTIEITVEKEGFEAFHKSLSPAPGERVVVDATLKPLAP